MVRTREYEFKIGEDPILPSKNPLISRNQRRPGAEEEENIQKIEEIDTVVEDF